ncbi:MAG TPA: SusD/RagB family nutrient-binding outer membrane lipoprotein [Puia sp.]|nr:SusD/RagB family nutrient-binding outer membrane lipoprotein [Puia sp.]
MKKVLIYAVGVFLLTGSLSSCKKTLQTDYVNAQLINTGSLPKLLTGMVLNPRIHPSYWDYATTVMPTTGAFSQLTAIAPASSMYIPNINYNESRWDHYYAGATSTNTAGIDYNYSGPGIMSSYREIQRTYAALDTAQQRAQLVYLQCAKIIFDDQTAQLVDLFGDIPFFKAGSLNTDRTISYAPFDDAKTIYDTLINDLASINTWMASATLTTDVQSVFKSQDILLGGNLAAWRRYANSLRLRLLMRISYSDEATAKAAVATMLGDPATYPMITSNAQNVTLKMSPPDLKSDMESAIGGAYAPAYLLDTLQVANGDPRTVVMWDSAQNLPYKGISDTGTVAEFENGVGHGIYTGYDTVTFVNNYNVPGVVFTAAEVSFLTAEANERWGAGSTPAATAYANGINQSVAFYYGINQSSVLKPGKTWPTTASPSQAAIDAYIANVAYTGTQAQKLKLIATQNWINFFILQAGQAWAEVRRTGYPQLHFFTAINANAPQPPSRLLYPPNEALYNASNYAAVEGKDLSTNKIFWQVK